MHRTFRNRISPLSAIGLLIALSLWGCSESAKKPTGGHWNSGIAVLRNNGLIEADGRRYRAAELLQLAGRSSDQAPVAVALEK